ncbi:single-stranded-DNA-specific exonuclease RecJ [Gloeomargarita lithophora Alchichica-D10]|uniref:Single-stranded-DNA-specific exonuclease RecJ n=1 Tax=Gloeomargarita lithophora Alchichica-D10 TaxID=1188229 RepID=A0A1J0A956_9CYAN|nr:single-stranded-DNA-specific exonuclease RecJ [Gloeomargarita lithophora]APB32441.1 single-stranded-DNA-specific exonuclease RecJ [Gloeomargarita lithophora Alchichica-D10]
MTWPVQRWLVSPTHTHRTELAQELGLSPLTVQILFDRGLYTAAAIQRFFDPHQEPLPPPFPDFADLPKALDILERAAKHQQNIAICGDYDADGMTSTSLLLRLLRGVGAKADYAIPSRMQEGYGINERIVQEFYEQGIDIIITVDNGIAAYAPIALARELGMTVIITDHHEPPPELPPAQAILNPRLIPVDSPYSSLAGVGVAYLLGLGLAQRLGYGESLTQPLLELCTLGTIADVAPLTEVNRRWVQQGLRLLTNSQLLGVRTLIQVAGLGATQELDPDHVGFQLGPRINAVGRIGDPQVVIELFTTEAETVAQQRAQDCEATNLLRRQLCTQIEQEAIAICENNVPNFPQEPVLVLVQAGWHHGVIGIVAARLVERYGVPVFLGTYEDDTHRQIRGSARSIPEFHVYEALHDSREFLARYGGHRAAGGFTLQAADFSQWRERLHAFGRQCLQPYHLRPLLEIHAQAQLGELTLELHGELQRLQPYGMANPAPQFWTPRVRVVAQQVIGKEKNHAKLTVMDETGQKKVLAWGWAHYLPLPKSVDMAYTLRPNEFQGQTSLDLQLLGVRYPIPQLEIKPPPALSVIPQCLPLENLEELLELLVNYTDKKLLLYGYERPEFPDSPHLNYDRPQGTYGGLILWTLPPAPIYLRWLVALARPQTLYIHAHRPPLPEPEQVHAWVQQALSQNGNTPWNLLALGQKHWVNPQVWVAGLRELGYDHPDWPDTQSVRAELAALETWYRNPLTELTQYLQP